MPVVVSVALTVALGTTPPDGSVTVPLMAPRKVWALAATASENAMRITTIRRFIDSIPPSRSRNWNDAPACTQQLRHASTKTKATQKARLKILAHLVIELRSAIF